MSLITGGFFYSFSILVVFACLYVIFAHNMVTRVLMLIFAFFNVAALFVLIGAEFLAMLLVIVYVGAIAVLFLFVVMMIDLPKEYRKPFSETIADNAIALFGMILYAITFVVFIMTLQFVFNSLGLGEFAYKHPFNFLMNMYGAYDHVLIASLSLVGSYMAMNSLFNGFGKTFFGIIVKFNWGAVVSVGFISILFSMIVKQDWKSLATGNVGAVFSAREFGAVLYGDYLLPFQLVGIALLIAMIGAIILTLRQRPGVKRQSLFSQITRKKADTLKLVHPKIGKGVDV